MDPKSLNAIRLVKQHTQGALAGPIKPGWLSLALPKVGKHRAWIDHIVEGVLIEIVGAYRFGAKRNKPFWTGPAYQVHRRELAMKLDCRMREISTAVCFLEGLELIWVWRKPRYVNGEPKGTSVWAIPNVEAIADMLTKTQEKAISLRQPRKDGMDVEQLGDAEVPDSGTQRVEVRHSAPPKSGSRAVEDEPLSLNVPQQCNAAGGRTAERVAATLSPSTGHALRGVAGGGSGGADDAEDDTSSEPSAESSNSDTSPTHRSRNGQRAEGPESEAPSDDFPTPKEQADSFIYYWTEAGRRTGALDLINVMKSDRKALMEFFERENVDCGWLAAMAIKAWTAAANVEKPDGYDKAWSCRRSKDIQTFLRLRSKILNELGANRYKVNAYKNLRGWFTDSELQQQGFDVHAGLELVDASRCWENDPDAPNYYQDYDLEMPPEVRAALTDQEAAGDNDDADHEDAE